MKEMTLTYLHCTCHRFDFYHKISVRDIVRLLGDFFNIDEAG